MGLDTVEIIMSLEDEFELPIPDDAASKMFSVDDTVQYITAQLRQRAAVPGTCQTARSFYRLRRELAEQLAIPRHAVRPETPIGQLVPPPARRKWSKVADAAGLRREPFRLFGPRFPAADLSVCALVESRCKTTWRRIDGTVDEVKVFHQVRQLVADQIGIPIHRVHRDSRYIDDLGVG